MKIRFVILTWKAVLEEWYCRRIVIYYIIMTYVFRFTEQQNPAFMHQRRFPLDQWINRNCSSATINLEFCWLHKPEQNTCLHSNRKYLKIQLMLIFFPMVVTSLNYCKQLEAYFWTTGKNHDSLDEYRLCPKTEVSCEVFLFFRIEVGNTSCIL